MVTGGAELLRLEADQIYNLAGPASPVQYHYNPVKTVKSNASELRARGHRVGVLEPASGWSRIRLEAEHGPSVIGRFQRAYPTLRSVTYGPNPDLERLLEGADLVLVHERTDPDLVAAVGQHRASGGRYRLLFHDTHHRSVTRPDEMAGYRLDHYDGVLAFGEVIRRRCLDQGWAERAWTWHEAADHRVFRPVPGQRLGGDLVWVGNWDEESSAELEEFLIAPAEALALKARVHGVRYPSPALERLVRAGTRRARRPGVRDPAGLLPLNRPRRSRAEARAG